MYLCLPLLTREERQTAHVLWHSLLFAPSHQHFNDARHNLGQVPLDVRRAVMNALIGVCNQNSAPHYEENPFA